MKIRTGILLFLTVITGFARAENLWTSDFQGYIAEKPVLSEGRLLRVIIDSSTQLDLNASYTADKELVVSFSGGDTGNLFAFLPDIDTTGRRNAEGEEETSFQTVLTARVLEIDETGTARIQGSRTMTLADSIQAVTVTGWVASRSVDADYTVRFEDLADSELIFRSFVETGRRVLADEDIEEVVPAEPAGAEEGVPAGPTPEGEEVAGEAPETAVEGAETGNGVPARPESDYTLTDERKRELLLNYINQFVQLIFEME